jgi:hypothetical protein
MDCSDRWSRKRRRANGTEDAAYLTADAPAISLQPPDRRASGDNERFAPVLLLLRRIGPEEM